MAKIDKLLVREITDPETGETKIIETAKEYSYKVDEDNFYMTFIDYIAPFFKLRSENAKNLLVWMCKHAEFNTGRVLLSTGIRAQIRKDLNIINNNTITNNLRMLKKYKLIEGEQGVFYINPQIFWKGETNVRRKLLTTEDIKIKFSIG